MSEPGVKHRELSGVEGRKHIAELIKDIRICMMVTAGTDGSFDSRPMATQSTGFDGTVWFLTRQGSGKVGEIRSDSHVSLLYSEPDDSKYVAMKGRATVLQDSAKIKELWNPMYKAWFPEGENDPTIAVLRVDVSEAQYWEASSSAFLYAAKYLAAAVTGGGVQMSETGKVSL